MLMLVLALRKMTIYSRETIDPSVCLLLCLNFMKPCLHDMFKNNDTPYDVRATKLEQPLLQIMACTPSLILALDYGTC